MYLPHILYILLLAYHYELPVDALASAAQMAMFLGAVCTVISGLSQKIEDVVMALLSIIVALVARDPDGSIDGRRKQMLDHLPPNLRQALAKFRLEGRTTVYATCPNCHCTYEPAFGPSSPDSIYSERCTNVSEPGQAVCNGLLLRQRDSSDAAYEPLKPFVY